MGWIRIRTPDPENPEGIEFGIERHRNGAINVIAWINRVEIVVLVDSIRRGWSSSFDASSEPPLFRSEYIGPYSPDGIAGQPSVWLYRRIPGK